MINQESDTDLKKYICDQFDLLPMEEGKYYIFTPFYHDDGDSYKIILKRVGNKWHLTDDANTFMKLSYDLDLKKLSEGNRAEVIDNAKDMFGIKEVDGELISELEDKSQLGGKLFNFIQAISKIMDIRYLSRERVKSTFYEDFKESVAEYFSEDNYVFDWQDKEHDPNGNFKVDCLLKHNNVQVFIFAMNTNTSVRDATISILQHKEWDNKFKSLGIFENMEDVSKNVLSRFAYNVDTLFPSLYSNNGKLQEKVNSLTTLP